jgi:hypothetical protein
LADDAVWEQHRVIVAAAVAAVVGKNARITGIRPAPAINPWAAQSRRLAVQASQNLANRRGTLRALPERGVNR